MIYNQVILDTITETLPVFDKVGAFFELYEDDAVLGQEMMDLKMHDKVNMKSVI